MGKIERDAVYAPRRGEILMIRGEQKGKTTQWGFQLSQEGLWVPGTEWGISLTGKIIGASFPTGIDDRIVQQRRSIDLMLDHLKDHCPKLQGKGDCAHISPARLDPKGDVL